MKSLTRWSIACGLLASLPAAAADVPAARLIVKPLLCVTESESTVCSMTFDIRWESDVAAQFCLNDSAQGAPLQCWTSALSGRHKHERVVSEAFVYWLGLQGGVQHLAEVKIEVLRLDSPDRRRERRSRHVWDVL